MIITFIGINREAFLELLEHHDDVKVGAVAGDEYSVVMQANNDRYAYNVEFEKTDKGLEHYLIIYDDLKSLSITIKPVKEIHFESGE